jgi:hypothetical protein
MDIDKCNKVAMDFCQHLEEKGFDANEVQFIASLITSFGAGYATRGT